MAKAKDLSQQKLTRVFSTEDELETHIVQELLRNAGIESVISAEAPASVFPIKTGGLAQQDIFVLESAAQEAQNIITHRG